MANQDLINEIFDVEAIKKQVSEIDSLLDATKKGMSDYAKQIKEASGNFAQIDEIIKNKPAHFDVISGDDGITFPLITLK